MAVKEKLATEGK